MIKRITSALLISSFALSAHAFNNSNFKGGYAFRLTGPSSIVSANEPRTVASGVLNPDGKGSVIGHGKFRSGGITCDGNISGKYSINNDGTGLLSSVISTSTPGCITSVLDLALVLADNGKYFKVSSTENDYLSGSFIQQAKTKFSQNDFSGTYALQLEGPSSIVRANEPQTVGVGLINANGSGRITGTGTMRSAGATCIGTFTGNYNIKSDGSGILTSNFITSSPGCFSSVVNLGIALFQKGNGVAAANTDNDYMQGTLNRQIYR